MTTATQVTEATDHPPVWDGLRPQNVVQAARADIERRKRNEMRERGTTREWNREHGEDMEQYAFLRHHVTNADGAFGLIQSALDAVVKDRERPKRMYQKEVQLRNGTTTMIWVDPSLAGRLRRSTKVHMKHLYSEPLLRAALELEP